MVKSKKQLRHLLKLNKSEKQRKISSETSKKRKGKLHPKWKGGRKISSQGYILIHEREHPNSFISGYMFEHRKIMEKHIGRYLSSKERVHHIDFDRQNNNIENLKLFKNKTEHQQYHTLLRSFVREELCRKE